MCTSGRAAAHESEDDGTYTLTRKVVSHHNKANDGWVIYRGGVYDVTLFLESHPGGSEIIEGKLGQDVSEMMHSTLEEGHEHSVFAMKLLDKYKIGDVIDAEGPAAMDGNVDKVSGMEIIHWDEPLLHQIGKLGSRYHKWIHSFPTTDHTVKMFTNDRLEGLTKCPWYMPLVFWLPVITLELFHYISLTGGISEVSATFFTTWFVVGMICWLLFEYSLHRWIFHWRSEGYIGNIIHFLIHGHHHITPMDMDRLVFPPAPALLLAAPFWYGAPRVLGIARGYPWLFGFAVGYLVYDMTHFWIHHGVPRGSFLKRQKRRHVHHHYFQPCVNFGISNPLFDYVFGTIKEPAV